MINISLTHSLSSKYMQYGKYMDVESTLWMFILPQYGLDFHSCPTLGFLPLARPAHSYNLNQFFFFSRCFFVLSVLRRIRKRRAEAKVLASTSPLCVQCAPKLQSVFRFCRSLSSKHCSQCWQRSGWNIDTAPAKTFYLLRNKHLSPKGTILFCFLGLWSRFVNYIPHWYITGPYFLASTFLDNWPTTSCLNLIDSLEDWIWAKTCKFCFKSQKSIKTFNGR